MRHQTVMNGGFNIPRSLSRYEGADDFGAVNFYPGWPCWLNGSPRRLLVPGHRLSTCQFPASYGPSACTATEARNRCPSINRSSSLMTAGYGCISTWRMLARVSGSALWRSRPWRANCCYREIHFSSCTRSTTASTESFPISFATSTLRRTKPGFSASP